MSPRVLVLAIVAACAACGTRPATRVVSAPATARPPARPVRVEPAVLSPPPAVDAGTAARAIETALPADLVRPRLVGLVRVDTAWGVAIEDSPSTGERLAIRAPDDPGRHLATSIPLTAPVGFAITVASSMIVLAADAPDDHVYWCTSQGETPPNVLAALPGAVFTRVSTRSAFVLRGGGLGGVVVARVPDEPVTQFAHPARVPLEHVTAWSIGGRPRRPVDLPLATGEVIAWLAAAASEAESAVVRVVAPRAPVETLDGTTGARVRVTRLGANGRFLSHADAPAPAGVTLDVIAAFAPDGTLAVAFLDAHDGAHALVVLPFDAHGPTAPVALDVPGPLHDGDAALIACGGALHAITVSTHDGALELATQRALPTLGPRDVLWRGEAHAAEGHVLATVCDETAIVIALQRAPIVTNGSLVLARVGAAQNDP